MQSALFFPIKEGEIWLATSSTWSSNQIFIASSGLDPSKYETQFSKRVGQQQTNAETPGEAIPRATSARLEYSSGNNEVTI